MTRHAYYHTCPICGANLDPGARYVRIVEVRSSNLLCSTIETA